MDRWLKLLTAESKERRVVSSRSQGLCPRVQRALRVRRGSATVVIQGGIRELHGTRTRKLMTDTLIFSKLLNQAPDGFDIGLHLLATAGEC
jgi:hypothetical protein